MLEAIKLFFLFFFLSGGSVLSLDLLHCSDIHTKIFWGPATFFVLNTGAERFKK